MPRHNRKTQRGYVLLVILLVLSFIAFTLTVALPEWRTSIRREREAESMYRARQYAVAIKRYYHKFNAYPPSVDRLKETNGLHFLRHEWPDPLVPDGKWRLIHFGDQRVMPIGMNAGIAPNSPGSPGQGSALVNPQNSALINTSANNPPGSTSPLANSGSASATGNGSANATGNDSAEAADEDDTCPGATGSDDKSRENNGSSSERPSSLIGSSGFGGTSGFGNTSGFGGSNRSLSQTPQTFGGGPLIGVASRDDRIAVHVLKKKRRPCQWEFVYDPMQEFRIGPAQVQGTPLPGGLQNGPGNPNPFAPNQTPPNQNPTNPGMQNPGNFGGQTQGPQTPDMQPPQTPGPQPSGMTPVNPNPTPPGGSQAPPP